MNSKEKTNFKKSLYNILESLNKIKPRDVALNECIETRLSKSYDSYLATMKTIYNYVLSRNNLKVIKAISKINKAKGVKNEK